MVSDYSIRVSAIVAFCIVILLLHIVSCIWEIKHSQGNEMPHILEDPSASIRNLELRSIQVPSISQSTTSDTSHIRQQPVNNRVVQMPPESFRTITPRTPCVILPSA